MLTALSEQMDLIHHFQNDSMGNQSCQSDLKTNWNWMQCEQSTWYPLQKKSKETLILRRQRQTKRDTSRLHNIAVSFTKTIWPLVGMNA